LSTICLKCLEKDPMRRYSSAFALAEDLERWLKHEPIQARHTGVFARGKKWVRRNPTSALLAACLIALVAAAGWIISKSEFVRHPIASGIAVLPFENLSDQREDAAAFVDGVQDDILTKLARIADLKVISRSSVMEYREKRNVRQIVNDLRVSHLLEVSDTRRSFPICRTFRFSRYSITLLRLITFRSAILASLVKMSSWTPSTKAAASSLCSLRFSNGRTAIPVVIG